MSNALKKINARVKVLQKKHPGKKRKTLQKQAGAEWRAGKLSGVKKRRKPAAKKPAAKKPAAKKPAAKKPAKKRAARVGKKQSYSLKGKKKFVRIDKNGKQRPLSFAVVGTRKKRRRYVKAKKIVHCRRVGSKKSHTGLIIGVAVGLGALYLLTRNSTTLPAGVPAIALTSNTARNTAAQNIVSYAQAAGATVTALTSLINSLNSSSDNAVLSYASQVQTSGGTTTPNIYGDLGSGLSQTPLNLLGD